MTHPVETAIVEFSSSNNLNGPMFLYSIIPETGPLSIKSPSEAYSIADEFQSNVLSLKNQYKPKMIHLFFAAPIALVFLIGQRSRGFGTITIYEYDFEGGRTGSYINAITLPNDIID